MELSPQQRSRLWEALLPQLESYLSETEHLKVTPPLDKDKIAKYVREFANQNQKNQLNAINHVLEGLKQFSVHTPHPNYYGLFNPRANFAGILADTITAVFNPQIAAWSHSPFAAEVEIFLLNTFGKIFGYPAEQVDGNFTSGGQEANLTATLCALNYRYPDYAQNGLKSLKRKPIIYCSKEGHHSVIKSANVVGLGYEGIKLIPTDQKHRIDIDQLEKQIKLDLQKGDDPFMIIACMGATGTGAIDPIQPMRQIADVYHCWLHADAAYGGAMALNDQFKPQLGPIALADSITFDAHKWLSVPMGAGMFITRHKNILHQTFNITADYMPKEAQSLSIYDPFAHSIQWSRRFIGLKLYLSLLFYGWDGFSDLVDMQIKKGKVLRKYLQASGWVLYNHTDLPIICFCKKTFEKDDQLALKIAKKVVATGNAWISVYRVGTVNCLRACITNYHTSERHLKYLVNLINQHDISTEPTN